MIPILAVADSKKSIMGIVRRMPKTLCMNKKCTATIAYSCPDVKYELVKVRSSLNEKVNTQFSLICPCLITGSIFKCFRSVTPAGGTYLLHSFNIILQEFRRAERPVVHIKALFPGPGLAIDDLIIGNVPLFQPFLENRRSIL